MLDIVIGFTLGISLYTSVRAVMINKKVTGILQILLTIGFTVLFYLFLQNKKTMAFGGSDWEFLVQTMTVDKIMQPWIILFGYILVLSLVIYHVIEIINYKKGNNK